MASRLSVVIVQANNQSPQRAGVAERLLIEVMGAAGLEPLVVRSLDQLQDSDTDLLALTSLTGDFVICDWRSPGEILDQLRRHGVVTERQDGSGTCRVHTWDLRCDETPKALIRRWQEMRQQSDATVVQIGLQPAPARPAPAAASPGQNIVFTPATTTKPAASTPADAELDALVDQLNDEHW